MRVVSTHFHYKEFNIETCTAVIKMGKYRVNREVELYKSPGDVWRMIKNDKEVKIN